MIEMAGVMCNHVADLGVSVTQDRTHLTGGEIQNGTVIGVVHEAAPRTIDDHRFEAPPVTNQVLVRSAPELGICISRQVRNHRHTPELQVGLKCAPPQRAQLVWPAKIAADRTALRGDDFKPICSSGAIGSRALLW